MVQSSNDSGGGWIIAFVSVESPTARATVYCIDGVPEPPPMQ